MGQDVVLEDLVSVGLSVATFSNDVKVCPTLHADSSPSHHTTTSPAIHLMDTTVYAPFQTSPPIGIA